MPVEKACSKCGELKRLEDFYPDASKKDGRHTVCKECVKADRRSRFAADPDKFRARNKEYSQSAKGKASAQVRQRALRQAALDAYGNKCSCCGESRWEFLTIEHVGGWGAEHRKQGDGATAILQWLKKVGYPKDGTITLLCGNCNLAMGIFGYCPHEKER